MISQVFSYFKPISIKKTKPKITKARKHYLKHKEKARSLVHKKLKEYSKRYKINYKRVAIKNNKTNWGSCSSKQNLNFNYQIQFLPEELQNYIIVHELCHIKELNHSKRFWALVEKQIPNYKELKKKLKTFKFNYD